MVKNNKKTFDRLDKIFSSNNDIYSKLKIYSVSTPKFNYPFPKQERVILLISGYRDIPHMWNNYTNYLNENRIAYYAPRTCGNGRSFFQQKVKWQDWVLTYFEAIILLSKMYKKIDIVGFSTGCNIGVFLLAIKWSDIYQFDKQTSFGKLILLSPNFEVNKNHIVYKNLLKSKFIFKLMNFVYPIASKPNYSNKREVDLTYTKNINKIYYERSVFLESLFQVWKFADILPSTIYINEIVMFYGDSDNVVGDFIIQKQKLKKIYKKKIKSYKLFNCGHNLINEHPVIRTTLFNKISIILGYESQNHFETNIKN